MFLILKKKNLFNFFENQLLKVSETFSLNFHDLFVEFFFFDFLTYPGVEFRPSIF